jgi:hypothetical protein
VKTLPLEQCLFPTWESASLLNSLPVQQGTNLLQGTVGYSGVKFKNAFSVRCKKDTRGQKATCSTERRYYDETQSSFQAQQAPRLSAVI